MDGFHIQCMTQDEGNVVLGAQISDPIPGKHTFHCDDYIVPIRCDDFEEPIRLGGDISMDQDLSLLINDADVHFSCV